MGEHGRTLQNSKEAYATRRGLDGLARRPYESIEEV
jgi:hypothetical protein